MSDRKKKFGYGEDDDESPYNYNGPIYGHDLVQTKLELQSLAYEDEPNSMFDSLLDGYQDCPECGYDGPLDLKEKGYVCPDCRELILPN